MGELVIDKTAETTASPATVFDLLRRGSTWPEWSKLDRFELESEGVEGGESVGAVRVFQTGRTTSRERVIAVESDERFGYALLSGLPLRDYQAFVTLTPTATGTAIRWRSTFRPKVPGTGRLYRLVLGRFIQGMVHDLAAHAASVRAVA